ncbi:hypothetical protein D9615_001608 [Tricholomella constricta]|uniref:Uncharacterized protein n=1 Tax=Tricholomella constricta TaxID=117010 RepID=A0A8H5MAF5_9AGAR|nr:hypothetical protein D9615_001608 [Tricholomella constricta]
MPKLRDSAWEKTLWKKQPFSDNYVPRKRFLSSLRRNNLIPIGHWSYYHAQLRSISLPYSSSWRLLFVLGNDCSTPALWFSYLLGVLSPVIPFGHGETIPGPEEEVDMLPVRFSDSGSVTSPEKPPPDLKAVKSSILIFLALMSLSPVLRTLTAATSSDSIWALSALLFILNALLADYSAQATDGQVHER